MAMVAMFSPTVGAYLVQLPYYAVWIIGIALCISRWQRHPKVSAVAMIGFSLLFLESLLGTLFSYHFLPKMLRGSRDGDIWIRYLIWIIQALIQAGLWGIILAAVFGWRGTGRSGDTERAAHPGD